MNKFTDTALNKTLLIQAYHIVLYVYNKGKKGGNPLQALIDDGLTQIQGATTVALHGNAEEGAIGILKAHLQAIYSSGEEGTIGIQPAHEAAINGAGGILPLHHTAREDIQTRHNKAIAQIIHEHETSLEEIRKRGNLMLEQIRTTGNSIIAQIRSLHRKLFGDPIDIWANDPTQRGRE